MRGHWNHTAPSLTQDAPDDNTSRFVHEQIAEWKDSGTLIHPEVAMEIAAWYAAVGDPGLCAFATKNGTITETLLTELARERALVDRPQSELDELDALIAYVAAIPQPTMGADIQFLLDGSDGNFRVMFIRDMVEMIEADAYYPDDRSALDSGIFYQLQPEREPARVEITYPIVGRTSGRVFKQIVIRNAAGKVIAFAPYEIRAFEN